MCINTIKNSIFPFFFSTAASPASWLYLQLEALSTSRAKYFGGVLPFFTALDFGVSRRAPGAFQLSPEVIQKMADFREFGSLRNANQDPGNLKGDPGSKINGGNPGV